MGIILSALFPTFAILAIGFLSEKFNVLGENSAKVLTRYVYYFALPSVLFVSMASEPLSKSLNLPFIYAFTLSSLIIYIIGFLGSIFFKPANIRIASMRALAVSSPNTAYMGIPVLFSLFGNQAISPVAVSTIILIAILSITLFILEIRTQKSQPAGKAIVHILFRFFKNPLVISPILGILFAISNLKLPVFATSFFHQLGMTAGPCALFAVGQTLVKSSFFAEKIEFSFVAFSKLLLHPLLMLIFIFTFHPPIFWAACGFILAALPSAAINFVVAQQYGIYEKRSSALIFETTLFSIITLPFVILIIKYLWPNTLL